MGETNVFPAASDTKKLDNRYRVWKALIYEDSALPDWRKKLDELGIMAAVSPKHDRDVWTQEDIDKIDRDTYKGTIPEPGDTKKPHWHVVIVFSGKKKYEQVYAMLKTLAVDGNAARPMICNEIRSGVRYLIHLDHKDKAQYSKSDVQYFGGFDGDVYFKLSEEQEKEVFDQLVQLIIDHNIFEYWDLIFLLRLLQHRTLLYEEMYTYVRRHPNVVHTMVKSRRFSYNTQRDKDKPEGEEPKNVKNNISQVVESLTEV